ncbi:hypothetical protein BJ165DRAFT_1530850 [Panaeolus papilionaceus]|nr:hypothetical protein BJ165DRAFT_1530850 [Panaeolus papilionaceus]
MPFSLPAVRISLYCALAFFTFILFCLTAARLNYTGNLPPGDPLNGGRNFHDPIAVELLITCLMTIPWSIFVALTIHNRWENPHLFSFKGEIAGLSLIWVFYISGAAVATSMWGNLSFCQSFSTCRLLSALVAFTWLGWLCLSALLTFSLLFAIANGAFNEPMHGRWNPRESQYVGDSATMRTTSV